MNDFFLRDTETPVVVLIGSADYDRVCIPVAEVYVLPPETYGLSPTAIVRTGPRHEDRLGNMLLQMLPDGPDDEVYGGSNGV